MYIFISYDIFLMFRISQVATIDKSIISTLHIINIGKKHYGNYTCQASNELGTVNDTINMNGKYYFVL